MSREKLIHNMALAIEELIYRVKWDRDFAGLSTSRAENLGKRVLKDYQDYLKGGGNNEQVAR